MKHQSCNEENFFLNVLRSGLKNNRIINVKIIEETNNDQKGKNFLSTLSEITLEYTHLSGNNGSSEAVKDTIHLFIKKALADDTHKLMFETDVFEIESRILSDVLPEIERIVGVEFGPKFIYQMKEPSAIIMENLGKLKFKNKDQKLGLSKDHLGMVVDTLAKYHAGSIAVDEKQPGYFEQYRQSLFGEQTHPNFLGMIANSFEELGKTMHNWSDKNCVKLASKIENLSKSIIESCKNNIYYDKDEFCVFNHGDCWINNMMFRENDANEPLEVRLIDFQLPVWTSPAIDLQYLLGLCPEFDIKYILDDFFLERYLIILSRTLEKLQCKRKPPTFDELRSSMWKRRSLALISGLVFYPKVMIKVEDVGTIKDVLDNQLMNKGNIYETPEVIEKLSKLIPLLDEKGYFD